MAAPAAQHAPDGMRRVSPNNGARSKEFDLVTVPPRHRVDARRAQIADIPSLLRYAEAAMGVAHPDSLWCFWRRDRLVGGVALLMLNRSGCAALHDDSIDLGNPPPAIFASAGQRPAAIYVWAILGAAIASEGIAQVIVRLQQPPYEQADIFALPATADGLRFTRGLGFHLVPQHPRALYRYVRLANRTQPSGVEFHEYVSVSA
jgi:hypothetical protein